MKNFESLTQEEMNLICGGGGTNWFYEFGKGVGTAIAKIRKSLW